MIRIILLLAALMVPIAARADDPPAARAVARIRLPGRFFVFADVGLLHAEPGNQGAGRTEAGPRAVPERHEREHAVVLRPRATLKWAILVDALRLATYSAAMSLPRGFVPPCLPTKAPQPPSGDTWVHEIKHDGFRVIARKEERLAIPLGGSIAWVAPRA
jgi:hypothetical protein